MLHYRFRTPQWFLDSSHKVPSWLLEFPINVVSPTVYCMDSIKTIPVWCIRTTESTEVGSHSGRGIRTTLRAGLKRQQSRTRCFRVPVLRRLIRVWRIMVRNRTRGWTSMGQWALSRRADDAGRRGISEGSCACDMSLWLPEEAGIWVGVWFRSAVLTPHGGNAQGSRLFQLRQFYS